jgi:hypothetical protein
MREEHQSDFCAEADQQFLNTDCVEENWRNRLEEASSSTPAKRRRQA